MEEGKTAERKERGPKEAGRRAINERTAAIEKAEGEGSNTSDLHSEKEKKGNLCTRQNRKKSQHTYVT